MTPVTARLIFKPPIQRPYPQPSPLSNSHTLDSIPPTLNHPRVGCWTARDHYYSPEDLLPQLWILNFLSTIFSLMKTLVHTLLFSPIFCLLTNTGTSTHSPVWHVGDEDMCIFAISDMTKVRYQLAPWAADIRIPFDTEESTPYHKFIPMSHEASS